MLRQESSIRLVIQIKKEMTMVTAKEVHDIVNQNLSQKEKEVRSVAIKILDKIVKKIIDEANSGRCFINIYDNWVNFLLKEEGFKNTVANSSGVLLHITRILEDNGFKTHYDYISPILSEDPLDSGWYLKIYW